MMVVRYEKRTSAAVYHIKMQSVKKICLNHRRNLAAAAALRTQFDLILTWVCETQWRRSRREGSVIGILEIIRSVT
jgi:hypothetical protein